MYKQHLIMTGCQCMPRESLFAAASAASRRALEMNWEERVSHLAVSQYPSSPRELCNQHPPLFAAVLLQLLCQPFALLVQ